MFTRDDLRETLRRGETTAVAFRRDDVPDHVLAGDLTAFSNAKGGTVLLGVEEDGGVSGVTRDDLEKWVVDLCRDVVSPAIIPRWAVVRDVEPGKDVAVVGVRRGDSVHSIWHDGRNAYVDRVGAESREATQSKLMRLLQQRGSLRGEARPVPTATFFHLDRRRLRSYFAHVRRQDAPADNDDARWRTLLLNTGFMTEHGLTVAAMLLFGKEPGRSLGQAGIRAMAFSSRERDYKTLLDHASFTGPVAPLPDGRGGLAEPGLVERAVDFVGRNAAASEDGARQAENPGYPPGAVREAVVNAIVHRDYLLESSDIELCVYADRVEVISPGWLPEGIALENIRAGCRAPRNHLLGCAMSDYGYMGGAERGVPRKIMQAMREHNGSEPELVEEDDHLVVRLFAAGRGR